MANPFYGAPLDQALPYKPLAAPRNPLLQQPGSSLQPPRQSTPAPSLEQAAQEVAFRNPFRPQSMSMEGPASPELPPQEPSSYMRFSDVANGPMQELTPGPQQDPASADAAYRRYRENREGRLPVAQEDAEVAKARALEQAYRGVGSGAGNIDFKTGLPRAMSPRGGEYARSFTDDFGRVIGWMDKAGNQHGFDESPGRSAAIPFEERKAAGNQEFSQESVAELRRLATAHKDDIGPYAGRMIKLQRSGLADPVLNTLGIKALDPEVVKMYSIAEALQNATLYDSSGKAINKEEMERLRPTMPNLDRSPAEFWVNLEQFEQKLAKKEYSFAPPGAGTVRTLNGVPAAPGAPDIASLRAKYKY